MKPEIGRKKDGEQNGGSASGGAGEPGGQRRGRRLGVPLSRPEAQAPALRQGAQARIVNLERPR